MKKTHKILMIFGVLVIMVALAIVYMKSSTKNPIAPYSYAGNHDNMSGGCSGGCGCGGSCGG